MVADPKMLRPVDSLQFEEGLGITAWVDSSRLLIGGRELMQAYGVALPSEEIERKYTSDGMTVLYIALSGEAAAMMLVSYRADKQIMKALRLLSNRDIDICLSGMDAHLSAEMISTLYRYPDCLIHVVPESCRAELDTARKKAAVRTRPGFIYEGSLNAGVRAIAAAGTCESVMNIESALLLLSVVMGVALTAILAFMGSMSVLTWITALIFQAFWSLVSLIVPALKKS